MFIDFDTPQDAVVALTLMEQCMALIGWNSVTVMICADLS